MLLAPLGLKQIWRAGHRVLVAVVAVLVGALLLNTALWVPWWGAWSWGSRLFVPALPLLAIPAAVGVVALRPSLRAWLPAALFVAGVTWAIPGTVTDLLGGYAATYDGSAQSFALAGYPPIGAWNFLHHIRAANLGDSNAVDIIWFRLARSTANFSLLVPVVLIALAVLLAKRSWSATDNWAALPQTDRTDATALERPSP